MTLREKLSSGFGIVCLGVGMAISIAVVVWLAVTDSEYAKHDQSLYAFWAFLTHWGWLGLLLAIGGFLIIIYSED